MFSASGSNIPTQRSVNLARVFEVIHLHQPVSRAEIAVLTKLTSPAVTHIVADLLQLDVVVELGRRASRRGQPAIELGVNAAGGFTVGLHFDHTCVTGVAVDLKGHIHLHRARVLPPKATPKVVLQNLIEVGGELVASVPREQFLGVGLATVGPIDLADGTVIQTPFMTDWDSVPLRQPLAEALSVPVYMDNNATAAAIGEYWYGDGHQFSNFMYLSFGSKGLGGGLFIDRRVYRGAALNAAEFGHMLVYGSQAEPTSGHLEARYLEDCVSGYAVCRDLGALIFDELAERLEAREATLNSWLDEASTLLAQTLVSVDHLLDLDAIVIGGQLPAVFLKELKTRVQPKMAAYYMSGRNAQAQIKMGLTGTDAVSLGAATLPLYDALTPAAVSSRRVIKLFKSDATGG